MSLGKDANFVLNTFCNGFNFQPLGHVALVIRDIICHYAMSSGIVVDANVVRTVLGLNRLYIEDDDRNIPNSKGIGK